jgi:hypothetical protein
MTAAPTQSQQSQTPPKPELPAHLPATAPPPGFAIYEQYNGIQLAFMKLIRLILRRK